MPYYVGGDYYGRGDYYRGDPFLGKLFKAIGGAAKGLVTGGPLGAIQGALSAVTRPQSTALAAPPMIVPPSRTVIDLTPIPGHIYERSTGGVNGSAIPGFAMMTKRRRRQMNYTNVRALRRASRRIDGFARVARKALKHTPFMLVSRASRGKGGSRGVITRSEAARALRA